MFLHSTVTASNHRRHQVTCSGCHAQTLKWDVFQNCPVLSGNEPTTHSSMVRIRHWGTGNILNFNFFPCCLSSLQKKSQQEDSEEEEEENAPQWHGSSETWRIAAGVNSPTVYSVLCMKWLFTLSPVLRLFFISACSLSRRSVNGTRCTWKSRVS